MRQGIDEDERARSRAPGYLSGLHKVSAAARPSRAFVFRPAPPRSRVGLASTNPFLSFCLLVLFIGRDYQNIGCVCDVPSHAPAPPRLSFLSSPILVLGQSSTLSVGSTTLLQQTTVTPLLLIF